MARLAILDKLDQELKDSQKELQVEIPKALKTAREHGDLSENAEFKAAKERQMFLESRVSLLQKRISDITSINLDKIPNDRSGLGSTLYLRDLNTGEEIQYHLVFPEEVNPDERKLSAITRGSRSSSKQEGDDIIVPLPDNKLEFEVLKVRTIHDYPNDENSVLG
jgi:transcription elongation factor GreA